MAGLRTGVDALIAAREVLLRGLPGEALYGNIPNWLTSLRIAKSCILTLESPTYHDNA